MNNFKEIPNEDTIDYLVKRIGNYAAIYDQNLFTYLRKFSCGLYDGGLWVVREYANGAFAYIFPEATIIPQVPTSNMEHVSCSLEAASIAANIFLLNGLAERAIANGEEALAEKLLDHHRALLDALNGHMYFVVGPDGTRQPTPEELDQPRQAYPELAAIQALIN